MGTSSSRVRCSPSSATSSSSWTCSRRDVFSLRDCKRRRAAPAPPRPHHPRRRHLQTRATLHPQVQDQWISLLNSNYLVFNITCLFEIKRTQQTQGSSSECYISLFQS